MINSLIIPMTVLSAGILMVVFSSGVILKDWRYGLFISLGTFIIAIVVVSLTVLMVYIDIKYFGTP